MTTLFKIVAFDEKVSPWSVFKAACTYTKEDAFAIAHDALRRGASAVDIRETQRISIHETRNIQYWYIK
jgi:hypothetical protein